MIFNDSCKSDEEINLLTCFISDRAIIYYKNKTANYIKISFKCKRFDLSDNGFIHFYQLRNSAYVKLDKYFRENGF